MSTATATSFWNRLHESRLLPKQRLQQLYQDFTKSGAAADPQSTAHWLAAQGAITKYQAQVLVSGKSGPFFFGEYVLTDRATSGRLAGLFRATHVPTGQPVWLSFFSGQALTSPPHWQALAQWAAMVMRADSPQLHRIYEIVDLGQCKFAVLEELAGQTFDAFIHSRRNPATQSAGMIRQAAIGVAALHQAGVLHGAIRPANLWFDPRARTRVLHFPLSRDPLGPQVVIDDKTIDYLAPELCQPQAAPSVASDVYALGCVLYQLIAGRPVFEGDLQQKLAAHAGQPPAALRDIPGVSDSLQRVVATMLAKQPAERYQHVGQLVEALAPLAEPSMLQPAADRADAVRDAYCQLISPRRAHGVTTAAMMANVSGAASAGQPVSPGVSPAPSGNGTPAPALGGASAAGVGIQTGNGEAKKTAVGQDADEATPRGPLDFWHDLSRSTRNTIIVGGTTAVSALLVILVLLLMAGPKDPPLAENPAGNNRPAVDDEPVKGETIADPARQTDPTPVAEMGIEDDGTTIWMAPTLGGPFEVRHLAPGVQMLLMLRPAELLTLGEGRRVFDMLGPAGESLRAWVQQSTGLTLEEIERLDIAFYDPVDGKLQLQAVVYPVNPRAEADMLARWGNPIPKSFSGARYHETRDWAYFVPTTDGTVFTVGHPEKMRELIEFRDSPVRMRSQLEQLIAQSDNFYQACLVFSQNYIRSQRDALYPGRLLALRDAVDWTLGPSTEIEAGMLSLFLDQEQATMFTELRIYGTRDVANPRNLAQELHTRIGMAPAALKDHLKTLQISPYSRDLLWDAPDMLEFVYENSRYDRDERQSIIRAYLPMYAAHNLAAIGDLALLETAGTVSTTVGPATVARQSIHEKLKAPTSLVFDRDTLERSLNLLSADIGVKIEIIGNDLQLAGITKNQSFGIEQRNKPAEEILQQIVFLANPDKTATSLADPAQKLVYVVKEKYQGGEDAILITTREQATKRGDSLPAAFGP